MSHPLSSFPSEERVAYLSLVASLSCIDGVVSDAERGKLRNLATAAGLDAQEINDVLQTAEDPASAPLGDYLGAVRQSDLRFSLITDLHALAASDGTVTEAEKKEISDFARELGVAADQEQAIQSYAGIASQAHRSGDSGQESAGASGSSGGVAAAVSSMFGGGSAPATSPGTPGVGTDWMSTLKSVGVPVAAVAAAGMIGGTGGAGLVGGLLGLGGGGGVGGSLKGAAMGAAGYGGARWLLKRLF
ncbi:MAG: TerB family tellurite resistance protein [Deltaproteobacteria bacterium]|nr:TerB family tellurite resistance protein [Deltaproteobacteria bacterium]